MSSAMLCRAAHLFMLQHHTHEHDKQGRYMHAHRSTAVGAVVLLGAHMGSAVKARVRKSATWAMYPRATFRTHVVRRQCSIWQYALATSCNIT